MTSRTWSRAAAMLAVTTLTIPAAAHAVAPADSGVVERAPRTSAWLLNGDGFQVVTGPQLSAPSCAGLNWQQPMATVVDTPGGVDLTRLSHTDNVWVFDDEGIGNSLEWIMKTCGALMAGGSAPEPLASGEGLVRLNSRVDADGVEHGRITVTARLTTSDGRDVHLTAHGLVDELTDFVSYGG